MSEQRARETVLDAEGRTCFWRRLGAKRVSDRIGVWKRLSPRLRAGVERRQEDESEALVVEVQ